MADYKTFVLYKIDLLKVQFYFIHSYFPLLPLVHRASVKHFISHQFLNIIDSR
jgi:hypothetical protein